MEKIKDLFHDFSDIFLALVIASVMFAVLSLNLGTWFNDSSNTVSANEQNIVQPNNTTDNSLEIGFDYEEEEEEGRENEDINKEKAESERNSDEVDETEKDNDTTDSPKIITISIPNGTPGSGVARILRDNGLINNTNDFIHMAENLNLANKLKSGSFNISTDNSLEDIIRIISGQNI